MTNRKLFLNLAVGDLDASVEFFTKLGFAFDERFTDETATCMLVGEDAYVLDVRDPDEWVAGHTRDAVHLPMMEIGLGRGLLAEAPFRRLCERLAAA